MIIREVLDQEKEVFDALASHPLQTWAWGDFKKSTGVEVVRLALFDGQKMVRTFQMSLHSVPKLKWLIGYYPKGGFVDSQELFATETICKKYNLVFVKMEPDVWAPVETATSDLNQYRSFLTQNGCQLGRPQFTKYTFQVDLTQTEDQLFANLKSKWRYNIRVAQKNNVLVSEDNSDEAFGAYLDLWRQTTKRQQFYSHDEKYHKNMWKEMRKSGTAHLLKATYNQKVLGVWILFIHNNKLYYPYGASSREHREVMANNLLAWEAIRFGKNLGCQSFDMWGSLGPNPDEKDPWFGFHRFKEGYGGKLMESVGTYDYVFDPSRYKIFTTLDTWRWKFLRLRARLPF